MPHRLYNDEKIKLIILYLLNELDESFDFQTISEIIVWDGSINYFVFTDCFNQLVENGAIEKSIDPDTQSEIFRISELGKTSIEAVEDSLLKFIKVRIMRSATRLLAFKKDGSSVETKLDPKDGGYQLTCTVKNKKFNLLQLKLFFDNQEEAQMLQIGFEKRAEEVYSGILALLTEDSKFIL